MTNPANLPAEIVDAEIVETAEAVDADDRCLASTGVPTSASIACPVHADGAHHCYQGPGHQGAKATTRLGPMIVVERKTSNCDHNLPEFATHTCDCGFAWANIVQKTRPDRSQVTA